MHVDSSAKPHAGNGVENAQDAKPSQATDLDAVLDRWTRFRLDRPDNPDGYLGPLRALRAARRPDLLASVAEEAVRRFPNNLDIITIAARAADATRDVDWSDQYWRRAAALQPKNAAFSLAAAQALIGPRKGRRKRMPEVIKRLQDHNERFPEHVAGYVAHIAALKEMRRYDVAHERAKAWCARFPMNAGIGLAHVEVFEAEGSFDAALAELVAVRARVEATADVASAYVRILSCTGRHQEAEAAYVDAHSRYPRDSALMVEYAHVASRQSDWREAERRLMASAEALPKDRRLQRELAIVRHQLTEPAADEAPGGRSDALASPAHAELFSRFESLGGSGMGCEFGMIQRRLGSDSLGLLRWTRTNARELIAALQCDFEGVGSEENTELQVVRLGVNREEYVTRDKRFLMGSHTFVRTSDAPADRMFQQSCRRLRFLRGKLIEDLQAADKIFVYRAQTPIDDATVFAMKAAMSRYGETALLCVMREDDHFKAGSLRVMGRGVFVGYVKHFLKDDTSRRGSDIENWIAVCRQADDAWRAIRQEST